MKTLTFTQQVLKGLLTLTSALVISACTLNANKTNLGQDAGNSSTDPSSPGSSPGGSTPGTGAEAPEPQPPAELKLFNVWSSSSTTPTLSWNYPGTGNSQALANFEVCLGDAQGSCNLAAWQPVGTDPAAVLNSVSLTDQTTYYLSVRAVDSNGKKSIPVTGEFTKIASLTVDPGSTLSSNWNYRVKSATPNVACDGTEINFNDCLNAGLLRSVTYAGPSSCSGYTLADELDVFDWKCSAGANSITFTLWRMKEGKALKDLLNDTSWKSNRVVLKQGTSAIAASDYQPWWSNPVQVIPENTGTVTVALSSSNTVYTIPTSQTHSGLKIAADNVTVTTLGDAVLTLTPTLTSVNCDYGKCLIEVPNNKFAWIEGRYKGATVGIYLATAPQTYVANYYGTNLSTYGIYIPDSSNAKGATFSNVHIANSGTGINCDSSSGKTLVINSSFTNNNYGIDLGDFCNGFLVMDSQFIGNSTKSIYVYASRINIVNTMVANSTGGIYMYANMSGQASNIHHSSFLNNTTGIELNNNDNTTISNVSILDGGSSTKLKFSASDNNKLSGFLLLDGTTCSVTGGVNTGTTATCGNQGSSNATFFQLGNTWLNSFIGGVTSDDSKNTSDVAGSSTYASITDWFNFSSRYRSWVRTPIAAPNFGSKCSFGTCQILDLGLNPADTILKNTTGSVTSSNAAFVAGAACPAWLSGNVTVTDKSSTPNTYLRNAKEIVMDGIGDDDGLCESNESCIALPNWGTDQGSGDYYSQGTCNFSSGTVSGVNVYAYPN